jgi:Right handed beta helix region
MVETRRSLLKKLGIGAIGLWAGSKRALASYFSENSNPTRGAADFYVAPNGKDSNPGTQAAPFATLAKARDAVRKRVASGLTGNVLVLIHAGIYQQTETVTFGPEDSGTDKFSITYAASAGEKVILSGGRKITGWKKGPSAIWTAEVPESKAGGWYFRQLFVNGKRGVRARTPNADDQTPWWAIKTSTATREAPPPEDAPIPVSLTGPVKAYSNPTDVELVYIRNNEEGRKRLGAINVTDQTLTLAPPHRWNSRVFTNDWSLSLPAAGKACYLENALEMLDQPGEWYLDRNSGVLSYWPRDGEDLTRDEVVAPVLQKTMLAVIGTPERPVLNIHFKGIHVEHVDWPLPAWGYMALFCCNLQTGTDPRPGHRPMNAAVEYEFARSCSFTDGGIAHVGGMGICLRNGTSFDVIEGNEISDLGGGGIFAGYANVAGLYLYAAPPPEKDEYKGYRIANNYVHHCGTDYYGAVGILLFSCQDTVVSHNLVHDTAYIGMGVAGSQDPKLPFARNNVIEHNHVHDAMKVTTDGAGLYVTFAQLDRGCIVRSNLIHDTHGNPIGRLEQNLGEHPPSGGLYLDGDSSGGHYENNVLYRNFAAGPIIFNSRTAEQDNTWLDNLFQREGTPPQEFVEAMEAHAGLEPAYQRSVLRKESNSCKYFSLVDSAANKGMTAYQFDLPSKSRGVIEIICRREGGGGSEILKLRGLDGSAKYELKSYASALARKPVWGSHDMLGPETMVMLSDAAVVPLSDAGLSVADGKTISGRQLTEQGLTMRLAESPQVMWIAYQRM